MILNSTNSIDKVKFNMMISKKYLTFFETIGERLLILPKYWF